MPEEEKEKEIEEEPQPIQPTELPKEESKKFEDVPMDTTRRILLTPTHNLDAANKKYVDDNAISYQTMIFYPEPNPEFTSTDGIAERETVDEAWATLKAGAGTKGSALQGHATYGPYVLCNVDADKWGGLGRAIFLFNTSDLPDDCTIVSATFSISIDNTTNTFTAQTAPFGINVVASNPTTDTDVVAGDYETMGSTPLCDDALAYGDVSTTAYNNFVLNAAGLAAISKTGITKLGIKFICDYGTGNPTWEASCYCRYYIYFSDDANKSRIPKLKIVFKYA